MSSIIFIVIIVLGFTYLVASSFIFYHLVKFGVGIETKILSLVFIIGLATLVILFVSTYNDLDISNINIF